VTRPMPSMPVVLWDDPDGSRYHDAYFDTFPGVWRHGDWITLTDDAAVVIHRRSDATLNRRGIRFGSSDIYAAVEAVPEVVDCLVIGVEEPDDRYWMPLFVVLAEGAVLNDRLRDVLRRAISEQTSPRHLPDEVVSAPGVPHTRTGKKLEVPVKRILSGHAPAEVVDPDSVDRPELLEWYVEVGGRRRAERGGGGA
jgi:acetoacetyl-CoA synthetase